MIAVVLSRVRELSRWPPHGLPAVLGLLVLATALPAAAELLYRLETRCSLTGGPFQPCVVEASRDGDSLLVQHSIGRRTETIRFSAAPLRVSRRQLSTSQWQPVRLLGLRFSTQTVCFDGRMLCVINPNDLERVRQGNPLQLEGRDRVKVHFGRDGRIDASCFDEGCEVSFQ